MVVILNLMILKVLLILKMKTIIDQENNTIYLENFDYNIIDNLFKSVGKIKIVDKKE